VTLPRCAQPCPAGWRASCTRGPCSWCLYDTVVRVRKRPRALTNHLVPVVQVGLVRGLESEGEACVVDEHAHVCKVGRQRLDRLVDGGAVGHVKAEDVHGRLERRAELGLERLQELQAAARDHHFVPLVCESACGGGAQADRGTRHQHRQLLSPLGVRGR